MSQMHVMVKSIVLCSHVGDTPHSIPGFLMGMDYKSRSPGLYGTSPSEFSGVPALFSKIENVMSNLSSL